MLTQEQAQILTLLGTLEHENIDLAEQLAIGLEINILNLLKDAGFNNLKIFKTQDLPTTKIYRLYESVYCSQNLDITAIKWLTALQSVNFSGAHIYDITPLQGLTNLRFLDLGFTRISDIKPIENLCQLQGLSLKDTINLCDLSPLYKLTGLKEVHFGVKKLTKKDRLTVQAKLPQTHFVYYKNRKHAIFNFF